MFTHSFPDELITLEVVPVEDERFLKGPWERAYRFAAQNASYIWRRIGPGRRIVAGFETDEQLRHVKDNIEKVANCSVLFTTRFAYRETVSSYVVEESLVRRYLPSESNPTIASFVFTLEPALDNNPVHFESVFELKSVNTFLNSLARDEASFLALKRHFIVGYRWGYPFAAMKIGLSGWADFEHYSPESYLGNAFRNALHKADMMLIEPIMRLQLNVPALLGETMLRDLRQRGVNAMSKATDNQWLIEGEANLSDLYDYPAAFAKLTEGQGTLEMTRNGYREVAPETMRRF